MAKRIATQLTEGIEEAVDVTVADGHEYVEVHVDTAKQWLKWAKALDARMRLDGSKLNRKRKPAAK